MRGIKPKFHTRVTYLSTVKRGKSQREGKINKLATEWVAVQTLLSTEPIIFHLITTKITKKRERNRPSIYTSIQHIPLYRIYIVYTSIQQWEKKMVPQEGSTVWEKRSFSLRLISCRDAAPFPRPRVVLSRNSFW